MEDFDAGDGLHGFTIYGTDDAENAGKSPNNKNLKKKSKKRH